MKDAEAEMAFRRIRWADTNGEPVCPHCGGVDAYDCRRLKGAPRFRCRACVKDFSVTAGRCSPPQAAAACYLAAIAIFCNEVKGKSALALSRDLGVSYKCAFVLLHKLREAMAEELKGRTVGGEGKTAEVDGGYFGGYMKPANCARTAAIAALREIRTASARSWSSSASAVAIRSRRCSSRKPRRWRSSARCCQGHHRQRRRSWVMGRAAHPLRDEAHQS